MMFEFIKNNIEISVMIKPLSNDLTTQYEVYQYNKNVIRNVLQNKQICWSPNSIEFQLQNIVGHHWTPNSKTLQPHIRSSIESLKMKKNKQTIGHAHKDFIFYYLSNIFVAINIHTKKTEHIYEEIHFEGELELVRFFSAPKQSLFIALKRKGDQLYVSFLWVDSFIESFEQQRIETVKVLRMGQHQYKNQSIIDVQYHPQKKYLFVLSKTSPQPTNNLSDQEFLQIFQIHQKNLKTVLPLQKIKKTSCLQKNLNNRNTEQQPAHSTLTNLIVISDHTAFYIYGHQYFRYWTINYHEKTLSQSNFRNIERAIQSLKVLAVYLINHSSLECSVEKNQEADPFLVLMTSKEAIFVKKYEIIKRIEIPTESSFTIANFRKEATQLAIEKSLNQIYKTKFRLQTAEDAIESDSQENEEKTVNTKKKDVFICCISCTHWVQSHEYNFTNDPNHQDIPRIAWFCAITSQKKVHIYSILSTLEIKIEQLLSIHQNEFDQGMFKKGITASRDGSIILANSSKGDIMIADTREQKLELKYLYGEGTPHQSKILSISAPQLSQNMMLVDDSGCIKIWAIGEKFKNTQIILDYKSKSKPLNAIMHPSGLLVIGNFGHQIKVFGIVSDMFEELAAIKTNDFCSNISYCKINQFLISNQKSFIKFYEPFTLECFYRIQPHDLKLEIKQFRISENGEFVVYQCCNNKVYRYQLSNFIRGAQETNTNNSYAQKKEECQQSQFCHQQSSIYTCFHFDFGKSKDFQIYQKQKSLDFLKPNQSQSKNKKKDFSAFVGFTETKYMVIYADYGERLVAQFPIETCWVTDLYLDHKILYLGTNQGSVRCYSWPIYEEFLQMQLQEDDERKIATIKAPQYAEFQLWHDKSPVSSIFKMCSENRLIAGSNHGSFALIGVNTLKNEKSMTSHNLTSNINDKGRINGQSEHEHRKLVETMSSLKFIKLSEQERINKLIQKTQSDIIKLHYQISRQKKQKMQDLQRSKKQKLDNYTKKVEHEGAQYQMYYNEHMQELKNLKKSITKRNKELEQEVKSLRKQCQSKIEFEGHRLQSIKQDQFNDREKYRCTIRDAATNHKTEIQKLKNKYWGKVKNLQKQFEQFVKNELPAKQALRQIPESSDYIVEELNMPPKVRELMIRVEELQNQMQEQQQKLRKFQQENKRNCEEDISLQKVFQKTLDQYNTSRYDNLNLHSEVLKMQNQLLEREEILNKKGEVISVIRYEKQVNETFKAFARGGIQGVQQAKQTAYNEYLQKQEELTNLFQELQVEIDRAQSQKVKITNEKLMAKVIVQQIREKRKLLKQFKEKLINLRKVLLLQGLSDSAEQKKVYQEQQKLLTSIKWLEKRFKMTCINEKKLINLKNGGVQQIIKQNKHLLQQCNQLREQSIEYENQIKHLSSRLAQANRIIDLERRVKSQKFDLSRQTMKLEQIRAIFSKQLNSLACVGHEEIPL